MQKKPEQARELFLNGTNCTQAVPGAFHRKLERALREMRGAAFGILARLEEENK